MYKINKATNADLLRINELLSAGDLPLTSLDENDCLYYYKAVENDETVGVIGIEVYNKVGLLRSMVVAKEKRNAGIARALVNAVEEKAKEEGIEALYLLTTSAKEYFKKRDYTEIDRKKAPSEIQESKEFSNICPVSAILMLKKI